MQKTNDDQKDSQGDALASETCGVLDASMAGSRSVQARSKMVVAVTTHNKYQAFEKDDSDFDGEDSQGEVISDVPSYSDSDSDNTCASKVARKRHMGKGKLSTDFGDMLGEQSPDNLA